MRTGFWIACASSILFYQPSFGQAIVVPDDNMRLSPHVDSQLLNTSLYSSVNAENCDGILCAYVTFNYVNGMLDFRTNQFAGRQGDYFLVSAGDIFSEATIGKYPAVFLEGRIPGPPIQVGTSDFFLGVHIGGSTDYGWVQFRPSDGEVTMVANTMSYGSRGIVVGTTQVVPEPTFGAIVSIALTALISNVRDPRAGYRSTINYSK
jgi:hypothetical protein